MKRSYFAFDKLSALPVRRSMMSAPTQTTPSLIHSCPLRPHGHHFQLFWERQTFSAVLCKMKAIRKKSAQRIRAQHVRGKESEDKKLHERPFLACQTSQRRRRAFLLAVTFSVCTPHHRSFFFSLTLSTNYEGTCEQSNEQPQRRTLFSKNKRSIVAELQRLTPQPLQIQCLNIKCDSSDCRYVFF